MKLGLYEANLIIGAAGSAICLFGFIQVLLSNQMERTVRRYLLSIFAVLLLYLLSNLTGQLFNNVAIETITLFAESTFSSLAMMLLTGFLLYSGGKDRQALVYPEMTIASVLWLIYFILLVYAQFSKSIYYFDPDGSYRRGPLYPLLLVAPVLIMLLNVIILCRIWPSLSAKQRIAFGVYVIVPLISMLIQMLSFGVYMIALGTSVAAAVMLSMVVSDQNDRFRSQVEENQKLAGEIMLSQMQPHFLVNTLGAIGRLCLNAPEAKDAINKFSRYLRGNVDSLSLDSLIRFQQELEHTRLYLDLEKMRFGDSLQVEWELACMDFMLPKLTLQPIVENAVRYGVRGNQDGKGTVRIASEEYEDRIEVSVTDDGPGFDPAIQKDDGRSHVGIPNVRQRLKLLCDGSLLIESALGQGTRVTIRLPK